MGSLIEVDGIPLILFIFDEIQNSFQKTDDMLAQKLKQKSAWQHKYMCSHALIFTESLIIRDNIHMIRVRSSAVIILKTFLKK